MDKCFATWEACSRHLGANWDGFRFGSVFQSVVRIVICRQLLSNSCGIMPRVALPYCGSLELCDARFFTLALRTSIQIGNHFP